MKTVLQKESGKINEERALSLARSIENLPDFDSTKWDKNLFLILQLSGLKMQAKILLAEANGTLDQIFKNDNDT